MVPTDMPALGPPVQIDMSLEVEPSHTLEHLHGVRFQKQQEEQLDRKTALLFNSKKSKDHLKKYVLQKDPARQANFEDEHYLLHIPLLFTKLDLRAFSTAECFWRWREAERTQHTLRCPRTAQTTQVLLFR